MPSATTWGGGLLPSAPSSRTRPGVELVASLTVVVPWWRGRLGFKTLQEQLLGPSSLGVNEVLGWGESLRDYDSDFLAL